MPAEEVSAEARSHVVSLGIGAAIFFFNDTATTEIYTLSLHDALPISAQRRRAGDRTGDRDRQIGWRMDGRLPGRPGAGRRDRKSTRLNSSHANISYAVFCLKKKKCMLYMRSRRIHPVSRQHTQDF